jgi:hypothetical protein
MAEKHELVYRGKRQMMLNNFLGGIAWALGATVGLSLIIGVLTLIAKQVDLIPIVGSFVSEIIDYVLNYNRSL